jgi:hypothetical protein
MRFDSFYNHFCVVEWHVLVFLVVEYYQIYAWYFFVNPKFISMFQGLLAILESEPLSMQCPW